MPPQEAIDPVPAPIDPVVPDTSADQIDHLDDVDLVTVRGLPRILPDQSIMVEEELTAAVEPDQLVRPAPGAAFEEVPELIMSGQ